MNGQGFEKNRYYVPGIFPLGWELKTSFDGLVNMMTDADLALAEREKRADG